MGNLITPFGTVVIGLLGALVAMVTQMLKAWWRLDGRAVLAAALVTSVVLCLLAYTIKVPEWTLARMGEALLVALVGALAATGMYEWGRLRKRAA